MRGLNSWLKSALCFFTGFISFQQTEAANYYIAPNGNDSNPGTISSPWQTLKKAVSMARGGEVIYVRGGGYTEEEIWLNSDRGTGPGKLLTIKAYPNKTPIFTNGSRGLIIDISYVRIEGLNFTNGKSIYNLSKVSQNEFINT